MKLLTKEIESRLPELYGTENVKLEDKMVQVKFFTPWTSWTWYGVEYDPTARRFWGLVDGQEQEWGFFMLDELEEISGPAGLKIERDLHFKPRKIKEIKEVKKEVMSDNP